MEVKKVAVVDYCRSPIGSVKGPMNQIKPLDLGNQTLRALVERNPNLDLKDIEMLCLGVAFPEAEQGMNLARQLVLKAGLPNTVAAATVNQFCGSTQQATLMLADAIAVGKGDVALACGLEHMKRVPMGGFNPFFDEELNNSEFYIGMGMTAENLAKELNISREEQETFSMDSHKKALKAVASGVLGKDIVPISIGNGTVFSQDECPREPDVEKVKSLKPAFDTQGTVTAATSSPVTTGASAMLLMSHEKAESLGLPIRGTIVTSASAGCPPTKMGMGPLPATEKALKRAGLSMDDIDVIELNEAFAAQALYCVKKGNWPVEKVNRFGGAIAMGHPLGMSGGRLIGQAITTLENVNGTYGIATMCIGGGQGITTIVKRGK